MECLNMVHGFTVRVFDRVQQHMRLTCRPSAEWTFNEFHVIPISIGCMSSVLMPRPSCSEEFKLRIYFNRKLYAYPHWQTRRIIHVHNWYCNYITQARTLARAYIYTLFMCTRIALTILRSGGARWGSAGVWNVVYSVLLYGVRVSMLFEDM